MPSAFARLAVVFHLISTVALWGMIPLMTGPHRMSALYYAAVQFYLHFQFNGWFLFGVMALFLRSAESRGAALDRRAFRRALAFLVPSVFLTYALAVAWSNPKPFVFAINGAGVVVQLIAFGMLAPLFWRARFVTGAWHGRMLFLAFGAFALKVLIQASVVVPYIATVAYTIRNFVIGFLHLMLLGIVTGYLLGHAVERGLLDPRRPVVGTGLALFVAGFLLSESLLAVQGIMLWGAQGFLPAYYEVLFGISVLLPVSAAVLLAGVTRRAG